MSYLTKGALVEDHVTEKGWNEGAFSNPGKEWESSGSSLRQCLPSARLIKLLSAVMSLYL